MEAVRNFRLLSHLFFMLSLDELKFNNKQFYNFFKSSFNLTSMFCLPNFKK